MAITTAVQVICNKIGSINIQLNQNMTTDCDWIYRIVASTSPSRIEAHAGLFRSLMKGIFDPYVL